MAKLRAVRDIAIILVITVLVGVGLYHAVGYIKTLIPTPEPTKTEWIIPLKDVKPFKQPKTAALGLRSDGLVVWGLMKDEPKLADPEKVKENTKKNLKKAK